MNISAPSPRALGNRQKLRRNRKVAYRIGDVVTDGHGNILDRPLTEGLRCFGDPVEQLWGRFDQPRQWGDKKPEPRGCAGCPVAMFCRNVVTERLESSDQLNELHYDWLKATSHLPVEDAHEHQTWAVLVTAIEERRWSDANDHKLHKRESDRLSAALAKAAAKAASARRRKKRKPRSLPKPLLRKIQAYRDARLDELLEASQMPSPPLWIRNRDYDRLVLIPDAWQARETLEQGNRKASMTEVQKWLEAEGRIGANSPAGMTQRIGEALRRADQLVADDAWPFFDPNPLPLPRGISGNTGLHPSAIHTVLDPKD